MWSFRPRRASELPQEFRPRPLQKNLRSRLTIGTLEQLLTFDAGAENLEEEDDADKAPPVSFDRVPARRIPRGRYASSL